MSPRLRRTVRLRLSLGIGCCLLAAAALGDPGTPATGNPPKTPTPELPKLKSPVDLFRDLLVMKPAERERALTNRPPEIRKRIHEKLREYEGLRPDDREVRLRMTELRWYLARFMPLPATNRAAQLAMVPENDRDMVANHLKWWDALTPAQQQEVLKYEKAFGTPSLTGSNVMPPAASETERANLVKTLDEWNRLPPEQRQQMYDRCRQFFELTREEKDKTLHTLTEAERVQMEKALRAFDHLPRDRREKCLSYFPKFTSMSDDEREEFLRNAEHWQEMTPSERESWRALIGRLPRPPLPPGFPPPLPPQPGPLFRPMPRRTLATNPAANTNSQQ